MDHEVAQRNSLKEWGQHRHRETTQGERQKQSPISRQRGRSGCVRDFAYSERTKRNTIHVEDRHRHGLCNIAREKAERRWSLKNEIYYLVRYRDADKAEEKRSDGVLVKPRHRTIMRQYAY